MTINNRQMFSDNSIFISLNLYYMVWIYETILRRFHWVEEMGGADTQSNERVREFVQTNNYRLIETEWIRSLKRVINDLTQ